MPNSFKHFIRDSWLSASFYSGISHLYNALAGRKRGIITFHNVLPINKLPNEDIYNVDVTAEVFEKQVIFLKKYFRLLPIQEIENPKAQGFFLTVDDGMLNNYTTLAPLLESQNLSALFAVCPAMIDGKYPYIWRDHFYQLFKQFEEKAILLPFNNYAQPFTFQTANKAHSEMRKYVYQHQIADVYGLLKEVFEKNKIESIASQNNNLRYDFMNWGQVKDLQNRGHLIASHTMTHPVLKFLSEDEKRYELVASKNRLETQLNTKINGLVYPYGGPEQIDSATVKVVAEIGYRWALMNVQSPDLQTTDLAQARFALPPVANVPHLHAIVSGYKFKF